MPVSPSSGLALTGGLAAREMREAQQAGVVWLWAVEKRIPGVR